MKMKSGFWKLGLAAVVLGLTAFGRMAVATAAEENTPGTADRLQRLEQRVNQLAERQEQLLRRLGAPEAGPGEPMPQGRISREQALPQAPPQFENARRPQRGPGPFAPARARGHEELRGLVGLVVLAAILCNILLAVWIFTDIRKRGEGSGIFIAVALVAGIPAAIIYALVRIGDRKVPA